MKKHYKNLPIPQPVKVKPKKKTKAQLRREWEYTVIAGGLIRASAFPRTAMMLNKGRGAVVQVIAVPLYAACHLECLEEIAEYGYMGQTAAEVASWMIMDAVIAAKKKGGLLENFKTTRRLVRDINSRY